MNARFGDDGGVSFSMRGALHWYVDWQGQMFRLGTTSDLVKHMRALGLACTGRWDVCRCRRDVGCSLTRYFAALIGVELNIGLDSSEKGDSTLSMPMGRLDSRSISSGDQSLPSLTPEIVVGARNPHPAACLGSKYAKSHLRLRCAQLLSSGCL